METNSERRRRKLTDICANLGIKKVADRAGLNWQSLDQIIKMTPLPAKKDGSRGTKNLGDEAARKIEESEGLGHGWFDLSDQPSSENTADLITKNMEDWRKKASPTSLAVIDTLLVAIQQDRFTEDDWQLYKQLNQRLLQRKP